MFSVETYRQHRQDIIDEQYFFQQHKKYFNEQLQYQQYYLKLDKTQAKYKLIQKCIQYHKNERNIFDHQEFVYCSDNTIVNTFVNTENAIINTIDNAINDNAINIENNFKLRQHLNAILLPHYDNIVFYLLDQNLFDKIIELKTECNIRFDFIDKNKNTIVHYCIVNNKISELKRLFRLYYNEIIPLMYIKNNDGLDAFNLASQISNYSLCYETCIFLMNQDFLKLFHEYEFSFLKLQNFFDDVYTNYKYPF